MLAPQPGPQAEFLSVKWCPEVGYGGARGGGKTAGSLLDYAQDVPTYGAGWRGILFRKTFPELEEVIAQGKDFFLPYGAIYHETKKTFTFPQGGTLKLRALERERDTSKFQGHQYAWICWEELGNWPDLTSYDMLKACLRSPHNIPTKRIRSTFNPGGPGHNAVKQRFIAPYRTGYKVLEDDGFGERMFIPARVSDNKILLKNDPQYIERLTQVGSPQLVKAWLEGDWDVIQGAFFPEFGRRHIVEPFEIPRHWKRVMSYDHGYSKPFACVWGAISSGYRDDGREHPICPEGTLVIYRVWYGRAETANTGLRLDPHQIAAGIKEREGKGEVEERFADPAIFGTEGGPSIGEEFYKAGISFRRADNERLAGWIQIRVRLKAEPRPLLLFFATCQDALELMPLLQHSQRKPEDADTDGEDHFHDALRYLCMARRLSSPYERKTKMTTLQEATYGDVIKHSRKRSKI